jgi:hypothetical protein
MYGYIFPPKMCWYTFDPLWKRMRLQMHHSLPPLSLSCMHLPGHWLALLLAQHASTIRNSQLCCLCPNAFSLTNHVPLDDGTHLITMKPTGFYSRVNT